MASAVEPQASSLDGNKGHVIKVAQSKGNSCPGRDTSNSVAEDHQLVLQQQAFVEADAGKSTTAGPKTRPRVDQLDETLMQLADVYLQPNAAVWQSSAALSSDALSLNPDQPSLTQVVLTEGLPYEIARLVGSFAKAGKLDAAIALIHELARHNRGDALQL